MVDVEGYVALHTNRYSVPLEWIGRRVEVRETKDKIEIQLDARKLVTHGRHCREAEHQRILQPQHRPPRGQGDGANTAPPRKSRPFKRRPRRSPSMLRRWKQRKVLEGAGRCCPAPTASAGARVSARTSVGSGAGGRPLWSLRLGPIGTYDPAPRGARVFFAGRRKRATR